LACVPAFAQETKSPSPKERYEALVKAYDVAEEALYKRPDRRREDWPGSAFALRFLELAEAAPDDPTATDALLFVVNLATQTGPGDKRLYSHYRRALGLLGQDRHLDDPRVVGESTRGLKYASAPAESFLRILVDRSQNREVRGRATLALGKLLAEKAETHRYFASLDEKKFANQVAYVKNRSNPEYLDYFRETDAAGSEKEAEVLFERAIKDHGDAIYHRSVGKGDRTETIGDLARLALHKLRDLAIGKVAPEIEGTDIEGRPMKLSDHRGKVVVLTFWATWCGPCMAIVPHERSLVERLAGKPFVLLGINGDNDLEQAKRVVDKEGITWRSWRNGGPEGPITDLYNVEGWPTVYVLDARGVIRHKEVLKERLDDAVNALLKELETAKL